MVSSSWWQLPLPGDSRVSSAFGYSLLECTASQKRHYVCPQKIILPQRSDGGCCHCGGSCYKQERQHTNSHVSPSCRGPHMGGSAGLGPSSAPSLPTWILSMGWRLKSSQQRREQCFGPPLQVCCCAISFLLLPLPLKTNAQLKGETKHGNFWLMSSWKKGGKNQCKKLWASSHSTRWSEWRNLRTEASSARSSRRRGSRLLQSGAGNAHTAFYGFLFSIYFLGNNHSLIREGAQRWRLRGGGASRDWRPPGPDLLPGKNPGNPPAAQLLERPKLRSPPFCPAPPSRAAVNRLHVGTLRGSGSDGSRSPPHPTWETYSHLW